MHLHKFIQFIFLSFLVLYFDLVFREFCEGNYEIMVFSKTTGRR